MVCSGLTGAHISLVNCSRGYLSAARRLPRVATRLGHPPLQCLLCGWGYCLGVRFATKIGHRAGIFSFPISGTFDISSIEYVEPHQLQDPSTTEPTLEQCVLSMGIMCAL
jgi:hypothetical protein